MQWEDVLQDAVEAMMCCSNSDVTAQTILNDLCCLISKLSHLITTHQVYLVLIAVPFCLRAGVTVFLSTVCSFLLAFAGQQ